MTYAKQRAWTEPRLSASKKIDKTLRGKRSRSRGGDHIYYIHRESVCQADRSHTGRELKRNWNK